MPRKPKVSVPRHFILCQESLWVLHYKECTETSAHYSGKCMHIHGQEKPKHRYTSHPTEWALEQARAQQRQWQLCSRRGEQSMALHPLAHIHYLSCLLQEICSWADSAILKSFSLFPRGCFLLPVYGEKCATRCLKGVGRTQHAPAGTQGLSRVSVFLPSGRILLMLRTVIRLLTSLLMLWATPGYCRTEWRGQC